MAGLRDKWNWVVVLAWVLAGISIVASIWMAWRFGFYTTPGLNESNQLADMTKVNMPILLAAAGQALASLLFGLLFTMVNSIYQTAIDSWDLGRKQLYEKR